MGGAEKVAGRGYRHAQPGVPRSVTVRETFSDAELTQIRELFNAGVVRSEIAKRFNVSGALVFKALKMTERMRTDATH